MCCLPVCGKGNPALCLIVSRVGLLGGGSTVWVLTQGRMIASGQLGENADIIVWDFETKRLLYRFSEHDHGIQALSFSRDEVCLRVSVPSEGSFWPCIADLSY